MKFVALISGGKDSFYNIMQCMQNGHSLHALANLHPSDTSVNELDSFMFQTVGHDIIDNYRLCIDESIPLYRRAIVGRSSNVSLEYEVTRDDEIEDLYELLKDIKKKHPEVQGVSCGAILSHYQRTRVENVCDRLNLTCLAYLWQRDQSQLMSEMCSSGLEAILIKVAAIGLTEKHLGQSLGEVFPILTKLNAMYEVHVCGEGGEFETLVLDAPFFIKRLRVTESKVTHHSSDASYLSVKVEVVNKDIKTGSAPVLAFPTLLSEEFQYLANESIDSQNNTSVSVNSVGADFNIRPRIARVGTRVYFGNLTSDAQTVEAQTRDILLNVKHYLTKNDVLLSQIQHVTVLVRDMANFGKINAVYESFFKNIYLPPSRVCVETTLPSSCHLQVSCIISTVKDCKSGIHIRSRSYWAPQNIGPYSQAIVETIPTLKIGTLSGQIPLIPRLMTIDDKLSPNTQTTLSLQHLYKVKSLVKVGQIASYMCYITEKISPALVSDIWNRYVREIEHGQDFYDRLIIAQVTALPRQASVEWSGTAYQKISDMYAEESDDEIAPGFDSRASITNLFKTASVNLGDVLLSKLIGNELDCLVEFLRDPGLNKSYVNVIANVDTIHKLSNMGLSAEWTPVVNVYDSDGAQYLFAVVWAR